MSTTGVTKIREFKNIIVHACAKGSVNKEGGDSGVHLFG